MKRRVSQCAFTLIELSIVLVVLALLIGTVMAGREMMKGQELRRVITDARIYAIAFEQFKTQYNAVPGDMVNAAEFWGRADGVAGTGDCSFPYSSAAASHGKPTCNGNGNGFIDGYFQGGWGSNYYEDWRAWQMLAAAGFISGNYAGIGGACCPGMRNTAGYNVPKAVRDQTGYAFAHSFAGAWFFGDLGTIDTYNLIAYGKMTALTSPSGFVAQADLTPAEAKNIDGKEDDGIPGLGIIQTYTSSLPNCATGTTATASSSTYILSYNDASCVLFFLPGFASRNTQR